MVHPFPVRHIGLIGGGQLARMMIYRTTKLGFHFTVLDPDPDCGAAPVADVMHQGSLYDREALARLVKGCEVTTYDIEHCDTVVLAELEDQGHQIFPSPRLLQTVQNKVLQKQLYLSHGLPVAPFLNTDFADLTPSDFPVVQKLVTGGYDGRGVAILHGPSDQGLEGNTYLEALVPLEKELGVMVARSRNGESVVYPVVEMLFHPQLHVCTEVLAPANLTPALETRARELAVAVVGALEGVGVFGVELFLTAGGELVVNEVAPRPHNSGHYTMEACKVCQFENHLRAVAGLPLGLPEFFSPAAMVNLLGQGTGATALEGLDGALAEPGFSLHLYGKRQCRPGRKMGHFTITAATTQLALESARRVNETFGVTGA